MTVASSTFHDSNTAQLIEELHRDGFLYVPRLARDTPTEKLAAALGTVIDIRQALPGADISRVQTLVPRRREDASPNRYSGHFGLNAFPLHTDLAHWAVPPRYLLLRALTGSSVRTSVLRWKSLCSRVPEGTLRRALLRPRRIPRYGGSTALRVAFAPEAFRWDVVFLSPLNEAARELESVLGVATRYARTVTLEHADDVLLVDNWRTLHGRSAVEHASSARRLERAYLDGIHP